MSPQRPEKIRVAIVDNDESFNRSLNRLVRAAGHEAVSYGSAAAYLADHDRQRFDCLILDIELGGMSGLELAQQLNSLRSTTPVIYLTGQDDPATRQQTKAHGAAAYFIKTEPGEALLEAIQRAAAPHGGKLAPRIPPPPDGT